MRFRSKKLKPEVGMEMTMTISLHPDRTDQQCGEAIIAFFAAASAIMNEHGGAWFKFHSHSIPESLEPALLRAVHACEPQKPKLSVVIDNTRPTHDRT